MLSHSVLAREQGYASIPPIYGQFNDPWLKKTIRINKFLTDSLERACAAFEAKRYGEISAVIGTSTPKIHRHSERCSGRKPCPL